MGRLLVRVLAGTLLALALYSGAFATGAARPTQAATTWQAAVGGSTQDRAVVANAFFPSKITINEGDAIAWAFRGFHTVTFLSGGAPPPYTLPSGEDNLPMINPVVSTPAGGPNYDGTGFVNSPRPGGQSPSFSLTFTRSGTYTYVCLIHPGMAAQVVVQPAGGAYPLTQSQVDAQGNAELFSKLEQGTRLIADTKLTSTSGPNGSTHYSVANGGGGNQTSVNRFLPVNVTINAGDSVTWMASDPHEVHTVTFYDPAGKIPSYTEARPQASGPAKSVIPLAAPSGGTLVDGPGVFNSGLMAAGQSYTFTFPKPGTYTYACIIHAGGGMKGTIVVQEAAKPMSLPKTGDGDMTMSALAIAAGALMLMLMGALLIRRRTR